MTALALKNKPDNELEITGEFFVCDTAGCLYWPRENCLIVSDLHLEKGSSFAVKGKFLPPFDTGATLNRLHQRMSYWQPKRVISLGDSFHDRGAAERLPANYHTQLSAMMTGRDWIWIRGNHDPEAPQNLPGVDSIELAIGPITFRHEPAPVSCGNTNGEIAGHLHPAAKIRRRGKSVRRRCFAEDGSRLIMPSFGAFTGGLNIRDEAYHGLFDESDLHAWVLGSDNIYRIGGHQLVR